MSHITREDVEKIALLSRVELTSEETDKFAGQLESILGYIDKLSEADISDVEPFLNAAPEGNVFREDVIKPSLDREKALANAPEQAEGHFVVPPVQ